MDNSKQTNDSVAGVSMYYDAESSISISSTGFRTLENISNNSNNSPMLEEYLLENNSQDMNSTLEATNIVDPITIKKAKMTNSPLQPFLKNILLTQFHAHCSTPTKEQLLRSVEVSRGSESKHINELGAAFGSMEKEDKENKIPEKNINDLSNSGVIGKETEDKENTQAEKSDDNSTLSSSVEVVTIIARKEMTESVIDEKMDEDEIKSTVSEIKQTTSKVLPKIRAIPQRRSMAVCEPNLRTNRPSRIGATKVPSLVVTGPPELPQVKKNLLTSRRSMLPTSQTTQAEKRPFQYASRMSTLVKTTLNSPARKLARRSEFPQPQTFSTTASRRSIAIKPKEKPIPLVVNMASRKSIMPTKIPPPPSITKALKTEIKNKIYTCNVCQADFSIKSLLDAHKRSHEDDGPPAFIKKASTAPITNTKTSSLMSQCKYCDKKFALVRALHIHLMQNCSKIPPKEKRKLDFKEMQHEEKAQLPVFAQNISNNSSNSSSRSHTSLCNNELSKRHGQYIKPRVQEDVKELAQDLANALGELHVSPTDIKQMAPPSSCKVKKTTAHSGVYRTPTKSVPCHICKMSFKSVLEYTHHNLTLHTTGQTNDD